MVLKNETFGTLLRRFRLREKLTQQQLAKKVKLNNTYISHLERDQRKPPSNPEFYAKVRDALDLTREEINQLVALASPLTAVALGGLEEKLRELEMAELAELMDSGSPMMQVAFHLRDPEVSEEEKEMLKLDVLHAINSAFEVWQRHRKKMREVEF